MQTTITAMDRDDDLVVETERNEMAAKRKASKMGGWQVRGSGAIIFDTTAEMETFAAWLAPKKAQSHSCHYCGQPANDHGPFGEWVCSQCGGRY